jgi:hypothetical protein
MKRRSSSARRGLALVWAIGVLALLTLLMGAVLGQINASRRHLGRREHQLQAQWLARSGIELAVGRLLAQPEGYAGETAELITGAPVRIEVRRDPKTPDVYVVRSAVRLPGDSPESASSSLERRFRRVAKQGRVVLEAVGESDSM